jgi:Ca2+-binding EF-hand superfamily protein
MEFLTKMLVRLGRAEQQDIDEILAQFDVLDEDRSGTLDMNDIVEGLKKQEQREQREQREQPQHQLAMPP